MKQILIVLINLVIWGTLNAAGTDIAILCDDFPIQSSHAEPFELKSFLEAKSFSVRIIDSNDLADPDLLQPDLIDIVIIPCGSYFPYQAKNTFVNYLKNGGAFISLGSYAFNRLLIRKDDEWVEYQPKNNGERLGGRMGLPGDWVRFHHDQIVIFDPTNQFKRTVAIGRKGEWKREVVIRGFPATALLGSNSPVGPVPYARWEKLVDSFDRYGRSRGSVFSLVTHDDGPYKGSAWAFCGVTNENLFSHLFPEMLDELADVVFRIRTRTIEPFSREYSSLNQSLSSNHKTSITFTDNYFRINGRTSFLFGTNQTGMMWFSPRENPATWRKDFARMRDHGLRVLRVLHFSPFAAGGYDGKFAHSSLDLSRRPPQKLIDQTDDIVSLCGEYGIAFILTLHDWLPVELSDEELDAQKTWVRFWAERYKHQLHVLFDIQNEPSIEPADRKPVKQLWNDFLVKKYGNGATLKEAWGAYAPKETFGTIPCEAGPDDWANPRAMDFHRFRAWLCRRWIEANMDGIKAGNPNAIATVGFLQREWQADKWLPTVRLDFSNTHYHGPYELFPPIFKFTDQRFRGKGLSIGEFGAWDEHEARKNGQVIDKTSESINHCLAIGHEILGMGGGMALNWDLKDFDDCVFPWGLTFANDRISRDWLNVYRNMIMFFSAFEPCYEDTGLYFLIPDNHRLGSRTHEIHLALHRSLSHLFACHVNFNVINESSLDRLPESTRIVIWPLPYCPSDDVFERVKSFVARGGHLYFSGEIGFDEFRKPTRTDRYKALGLKKREPLPLWPLVWPSGQPQFETAEIGQGTVHYLPVPYEIDERDHYGRWKPYATFLRDVDAETIDVVPNDLNLHLFSIPLLDGGRIYTLYRNEWSNDSMTYRVKTKAGWVTLDVDPMGTGLIAVNKDGEIVAIEGSGEILYRNALVTEIETTDKIQHAHAMIRSADGKPLNQSLSIFIFSTRAGTVTLPISSYKKPMIVVGEFVDGTWITYEEIEPEITEDCMVLDIDDDQATSIILLTEKGYDPGIFQTIYHNF